ncbi:unnamed protein product [Lactuca virosa]|uniref:Uncharacterized protein n=1 Tax=Lactuca virosa TaxID=75947 RepID=A0AAU9M1G2_9ASTR|nr:unnamed protein product [Lactuca virosa]
MSDFQGKLNLQRSISMENPNVFSGIDKTISILSNSTASRTSSPHRRSFPRHNLHGWIKYSIANTIHPRSTRTLLHNRIPRSRRSIPNYIYCSIEHYEIVTWLRTISPRYSLRAFSRSLRF